jgi:selenide,water dikinase
MGGKPLMAIAILGWPIDISWSGCSGNGRGKACADAGIIIAGGHSIDNPEPILD